MNLVVMNPNLSVIMPVGCNAQCKFCYWSPNEGLSLERFHFVANSLPKIFQQCSITGGEPTISPFLVDFLLIAKERFPKVVLNTNGFLLLKQYLDIASFVNISRHHFDDVKNRAIFNTNSVPDAKELEALCKHNGNVTLNCVLPDKFGDKDFISNYISFAKNMGAKIAFRKYFNNLDVLSDIDTEDTLIGSHSCGACLHRWHKIDDVDVTFKYSVQETYEKMSGIYELILQANGDLTFDWAGKNKLIYEERR